MGDSVTRTSPDAMTNFDDSKAYAAQEEVFFDDGREIELLHFVYSRPNIDEIRGSPEKVLAAIDEYGRTKKYLMNVGEDKGRIVTDLIKEVKPKIMIELGGYVGYSAVLFGAAVRDAGGKTYYSLERNPEFAAVILSLVDLAGLSDVDKVVVMFIDHYKPAYLPDLKLCEELGIIQQGTVLAADNVIKPGNPPYLEYVRSSVEKKKQVFLESTSSSGLGTEDFDDRYSQQYEKTHGAERLDTMIKGDPRLVYSSELIKSFEPTGVPDGIEVTRCKGKEG